MNLSAPLVWFLLGAAFLVAELMLPAFVLIFFTLGSWAAALTVFLYPDIGVPFQIGVFIFFSLAALIRLRQVGVRALMGKAKDEDADGLDEGKIGKPAVVTRSISPHAPGEIKCLGSFWRAVAETDIPEGAAVVIVGSAPGDNLAFIVKPTGPAGAAQPSGEENHG